MPPEIDWDDDPILMKAGPTAGFAELGVTGLKRYGNWISEEWLPELQGQRALRAYREMRDNEPVVGGVMFAIEQLIRGATWREKPFDSSRKAEAQSDFLGECRQDLNVSWPELITEILSMLTYGWSYHEIVYKRRSGLNRNPSRSSRYNDNKIGWRKIAIRSQDSFNGWEFGDDGGVNGMHQLAAPDYRSTFIPIEKALLFTASNVKGSPEGRSVLRNAYTPYWTKRRIQDFESIGIERDLAGLPMVSVPPEILRANATPEEKALLTKMMTLVRNVRRDVQEGIVFPLEYDGNGNPRFKFELLSSGGNRQFDTGAVIGRYDQRIAMTVLADFVLLGTQNVGSWAMHADKTNLFGVAIESWLDSIAAVFNRHAVPRLGELNGWDMEKLPTLEHGEVQEVDLTAVAEYVSKLSAAGMPLFPDEDLEARLRELGGLPPKSEEALAAQAAQQEMEQAAASEQLYGQQLGNDGQQAGNEASWQAAWGGQNDSQATNGNGSKAKR